MKKILINFSLAVVFVFALMVGSSQASFIGTIYDGYSAGAYDPQLGATAPLPPATSTFTVDVLNFDTRISGSTYGGFLSGA